MPPFLLAISVRSGTTTFDESSFREGPSPFPVKPWHSVHYVLYVCLAQSSNSASEATCCAYAIVAAPTVIAPTMKALANLENTISSRQLDAQHRYQRMASLKSLKSFDTDQSTPQGELWTGVNDSRRRFCHAMSVPGPGCVKTLLTVVSAQ